MDDLLAGALWTCTATPPSVLSGPDELESIAGAWLPATVPGTAAGAVRATMSTEEFESIDFDARDWWFRCRFPGSDRAGPWRLSFGGLATICDVWLNGEPVLESTNMFLAHEVEVGHLRQSNDLVIRCAALSPLLERRRPRARWKTRLVASQNLRWFRTTMIGRIPTWSGSAAPVGPWRPVHLVPAEPTDVLQRRIRTRCDDDAGVVDVEIRLRGERTPLTATLRIGETDSPATVTRQEDGLMVRGTVRVSTVERWWPHTHGGQRRYPVRLSLDDSIVELGTVGFRTLTADRSGDGFRIVVNDVPIFCRGACWTPVDPVSLAGDADALRAQLELLREAQLNMVRVTGTMVYEDDTFWDLCDELGILVWQDCMLASFDPPDEPSFADSVEREVTQMAMRLQGRPSLAVVSGGSEIEQQAAMVGLPPDRRANPLLETTIPQIVELILPGTPYVTSTPTGGDLPFHPGKGIAHYFGVGAYGRPVGDIRRTGVRFAAECLAFAIPPDRDAVERSFGGPSAAGHRPDWKRGVPRDGGTSWDFEDVRDHYVEELFGVQPSTLRAFDAERSLDLGRAAVSELFAAALSEWRRAGSGCDGAIVLSWRDLRPGAGWGVVDDGGRPKAPWWVLKRVLRPVTVLLTDEGLNGLAIHLVNDTAGDVNGQLRLQLFARGEMLVEESLTAVTIPARGGTTVNAESILGGFRDLTWSYRFGPLAHDVIAASLDGPDGELIGQAVHLPAGQARPVEPDVGLEAAVEIDPLEGWLVDVRTRRFAQWVEIDIPGYRPADSWFHLPPGSIRRLPLSALPGAAEVPTGEVRCLNSAVAARLVNRRRPGR